MKKKSLFILLVAIFVFVLTGCESENSENIVTDSNGKSKTSFTINETAVYNDVYYTVTNVEYSNYDNIARRDKIYIIVTLKIENKSDKTIEYREDYFKMSNSSGQIDDPNIYNFRVDKLGSSKLSSGGTKEGEIVFEEPIDETSFKVLFYQPYESDDALFEVAIK